MTTIHVMGRVEILSAAAPGAFQQDPVETLVNLIPVGVDKRAVDAL